MKIIDCCVNFSVEPCHLCGRVRYTVQAYSSGLNKVAVKKAATCTTCVRKHSNPKDFKVWQQMWNLHRKEIKRLKALQELDELVARNPQKRFFPILKALVLMRHPHEAVIEAVHRLWLGKQPTQRQWKQVIKLIRTYRNVRIDLYHYDDRNRKQHQPVGFRYSALYTGTGACGLW